MRAASAQNIAEVSTAGAGVLLKRFGHAAGGPVETLAAYRQHILAGGLFIEINGTAADPFMASLDDRTGKDEEPGSCGLHIQRPLQLSGGRPERDQGLQPAAPATAGNLIWF